MERMDRRTSSRLDPLDRLTLARRLYDRLRSEHRIPGGQAGRGFLARLSMPGAGQIDCALYRVHVSELLERQRQNAPMESLTLVEVLLYLERLPCVVAEPVARLRSALNRRLRGGANEVTVDTLLCDRLRYAIRCRSRSTVERLVTTSTLAA